MHKKILGSRTTTLIILSDEMQSIVKIVEDSFEDSSLLLKRVSEKIQNEAKEQKEGFLIMLLGILGVSFLGIILASKGITRAGYGSKGEKVVIRVSYGSKLDFNTASSFN